MSSTAICLIRKFGSGDEEHIKNIIIEATMEKVNTFFMNAIFSELIIQISAVLVAIAFIVIGIPFRYCLMAIPVSVLIMYLGVWIGHYIKAHELSTDIFNIPSNYMNDPSTCFFVAEMYGRAGEAEMAHVLNQVKKVDYKFCDEKEFQTADFNIAGFSKTVVGCVAITKSMKHPDRAWLRRMAVKSEYRRRHIATQLLARVVSFCEENNYEGIDLITTSCHQEARDMYLQEGFNIVDNTDKHYLGFGPSQEVFAMYRSLKKKENTTKLIDI